MQISVVSCVVVVACLLAVFTSPVAGSYCYVCTGCPEPFKAKPEMKVECFGPANCVKERMVDANGKVNIIKGCEERRSSNVRAIDFKEKVISVCSGDLCNSSNVMKVSALSQIFGIISAILLMIFYI